MCDSPTSEYRATNPDMKYVIITGGVVSGLGKGITASSIGLLLKTSGLRVTAIKIDPYLNIDAGTMSPYEHGEVFVLDDGGEVDLDLGNYERFLNVTLTRDHNITTGKVYQRVLDTERRGDYLGKTVQMVPHCTNCIQDWIERVAHIPVDGTSQCPQVCIIELGGTVGDIESMIFLEAIRQFKFRCGSNLFHVHVSLIPCLGNVGELKSKPTQHSMVQLRAAGLIPDVVVLRCTQKVPQHIMNKVSIYSMVPTSNIIGVHDVANIYHVPQLLLQQGLTHIIFKLMGIAQEYDADVTIDEWNRIAQQLTDHKPKPVTSTATESEKKTLSFEPSPSHTITIGIVGKYTGLTDSYLSVTKALLSAALESRLKLKIIWIESTHLEPPGTRVDDGNDGEGNAAAEEEEMDVETSPSVEHTKDSVHNISIEMDNLSPKKKQALLEKHRDESLYQYHTAWNKLKSVDGILIPGGFGDRGIEGKILAVHYARTQCIPFLGICLGMQMAVIEFCRNVMQLKGANSTEFEEGTPHAAVIFMPEGDKENMGGTMRLGSRVCNLQPRSIAKYLYHAQSQVYERHRHRYEVNPTLVSQIEQNGLRFTGKDEKNERMEIIELPVKQHPFFFGCQFHPEFKSGPLRPSPPFQGLIKAASGLLYQEPKFIEQFGCVEKKEKMLTQKHQAHGHHSDSQALPILTDLLHKFEEQ
mmetsp:Transcript_47679/g.79103  ORF Transcript_47679/g.79103 Transcript_47679/m.79103 type:complete len:696 (+) Transcript_47679:132-2219(+)|eukprot:CAMPEP_0202694058 /NCGR_PEP_ID=MMETSP1385-20130828/8018_1 /ASSEMBLY_ACC=CAM_ASM_000861 /TAXON_ID=933848 /ORGANISM="Elphidium margaritaceum" /LENGTH=695 /DNA_ID=CAMNT_0049349837 /DNA_START=103 /DNA_END=2190 /DNA_ORIENTATION=+